jgi:Fumarylacetoacetate (FAA) hydrolase family/SnoaL-like domain
VSEATGRAGCDLTAEGMTAWINDYFAACNSGDVDRIAAYFEPDGVHYFPPGMYTGPFRGARTIGERWHAAVTEGGSYWTVDQVITDPRTRRAVIEWTHFKRKAGVMLRGDEWYKFSERGLIQEIRASDALDYVAGYSLANDFAIHDFRQADRGSMLRVKGADTLAPMGPGLVRGWTPDAQESSLKGMVFSVAYVVADLARMMTLVPGDLIFSGTPANSRPVEPGDVVTVECDGLGVLENRVAEGAHDVSDEAGWMPESSDQALGVALGIQLRE